MTMGRLSFTFVFQTILSMNLINPNEVFDWVVVVSVSEWYDDIFHNWLLWYNRLDLELKTIVIAEDNVIYQKYANCTDFTTLHFEMEEVSTYLFLYNLLNRLFL